MPYDEMIMKTIKIKMVEKKKQKIKQKPKNDTLSLPNSKSTRTFITWTLKYCSQNGLFRDFLYASHHHR